MIDSLLFLPDVDGATVDDATADASTDCIPCDDESDAAAAAAAAASRDGHAHAARAAWVPAAAALERSAIARDALVSEGLAGPLVAARGWSDLATVRAASGDVAAARLAYARATSATGAVPTVPADLSAALDELHAALGPVMPMAAPTLAPVSSASGSARGPIVGERVRGTAAGDESLLGGFAGGLLWLDTTDDAVIGEARIGDESANEPTADAVIVTAHPIEPAVAASTDANAKQRAPPARIAAVDAAVALAGGEGTPAAASGGLASRLRRLLRR